MQKNIFSIDQIAFAPPWYKGNILLRLKPNTKKSHQLIRFILIIEFRIIWQLLNTILKCIYSHKIVMKIFWNVRRNWCFLQCNRTFFYESIVHIANIRINTQNKFIDDKTTKIVAYFNEASKTVVYLDAIFCLLRGDRLILTINMDYLLIRNLSISKNT